jgi:hypothetical protein
MVSAGHLGTLPLIACGLAVVAVVLVLSARRVFPFRISEEDHHRTEAQLAD